MLNVGGLLWRALRQQLLEVRSEFQKPAKRCYLSMRVVSTYLLTDFLGLLLLRCHAVVDRIGFFVNAHGYAGNLQGFGTNPLPSFSLN